MKLHPRVSKAAVELVKRFEGFRPRAERLASGGWIIGYGHTLTAREGASVAEADAEALLMFDLSRTAERVQAQLTADVSAPQFEALTAFAFAIGAEAFARSTVLRRVNDRAYLQAASLIEQWRRAEIGGEPLVVDALVRRRAAEKAHFLTPPQGWAGAPSAVMRPVPDPTADHEADERVAVAELRATEHGLSAGLADPPGRLGEPAPSAVLAVAEALRTRLDRILGDPEPTPAPEPAVQDAPERDPEPTPAPEAPVEPQLAPTAEPPVLLEPEPEPELEPPKPELEPTLAQAELQSLEPEPSVVAAAAAAPEPPQAAAQVEAPASEASPVIVDPSALSEPSAPSGRSFDDAVPLHPAKLSAAIGPRTDWLREESGGRRRPMWRRWLRDPAMLVFLFAAGLVMFIAALVGMVAGRPAYGGLALGVVGVALMAPAAGGLLLRRMDRRRG